MAFCYTDIHPCMLILVFILSVICMLALDLGLARRRMTHLTYYDAIAQSAFWIMIGLSFAIVIFFTFEYDWFAHTPAYADTSGKQAVIEYLTTYIVEKALSLDNLFVIALIFSTLQIPIHLQQRVLLWGILGAIVFRGIMIFGGIALINAFTWMNYLFGGLLLFSAVKLLANQNKPYSIDNNPLVGFLTKYLPVHTDTHNGHFFTRDNGKFFVTPLFVAMLLVESADVLFAFDSIPAVITISRDPFIVYSSNIFAILGLRALYFVLASALQKLHYLRLGLIIILIYIGIKMLISHYYTINTLTSLVVILSILILAVLMSLQKEDHADFIESSPLAGDLGKIYHLTYGGLKRILILVIGISVLVVGIIMIFTPGPAIIVIPAGLAILATEFIWARLLLKHFKNKFVQYSQETKAFLKRNDTSDKKKDQG